MSQAEVEADWRRAQEIAAAEDIALELNEAVDTAQEITKAKIEAAIADWKIQQESARAEALEAARSDGDKLTQEPLAVPTPFQVAKVLTGLERKVNMNEPAEKKKKEGVGDEADDDGSGSDHMEKLRARAMYEQAAEMIIATLKHNEVEGGAVEDLLRDSHGQIVVAMTRDVTGKHGLSASRVWETMAKLDSNFTSPAKQALRAAFIQNFSGLVPRH